MFFVCIVWLYFVLCILYMYCIQVTKLREEITRIRAAKEALGLDFIADNRLTFVAEEMTDLKDAWQAVVPTAEKLAVVRNLSLKVFCLHCIALYCIELACSCCLFASSVFSILV